MDLEIVKRYAKEHTVKDCAIYFNKSYDSMVVVFQGKEVEE